MPVSIVYPHKPRRHKIKRTNKKNHHHAVGTCLTHAVMATRYENVRFLEGGGGEGGNGRGREQWGRERVGVSVDGVLVIGEGLSEC
jgi:hypothetical protein